MFHSFMWGRFSLLKCKASVACSVVPVLGNCRLATRPCKRYFSLRAPRGLWCLWSTRCRRVELLKGFSVGGKPRSLMCAWFGNPGAACGWTAEGSKKGTAKSCGTQHQVSKCGGEGERDFWCQGFQNSQKMAVSSVVPREWADFQPLIFDTFRTQSRDKCQKSAALFCTFTLVAAKIQKPRGLFSSLWITVPEVKIIHIISNMEKSCVSDLFEFLVDFSSLKLTALIMNLSFWEALEFNFYKDSRPKCYFLLLSSHLSRNLQLQSFNHRINLEWANFFFFFCNGCCVWARGPFPMRELQF